MKAVAHTVRPACASDARQLLVLMRELARFEGYIGQFCVSEDDLLERGLRGGASPQFTALLAETDKQELLAYALVYTVPYTYDLRPNLVLKELYVRDNARSLGVGQALMAAVITLAKQLSCARLKWDVLPGNTRAQAFYRSLGGAPDSAWEPWIKVLS